MNYKVIGVIIPLGVFEGADAAIEKETEGHVDVITTVQDFFEQLFECEHGDVSIFTTIKSARKGKLPTVF